MLQFIKVIPYLLLIAAKVGAVIGGSGSIVEEIGAWKLWPKWVAIGQKLEAIGIDLPKLVTKVQARWVPLACLFVIGCTNTQVKTVETDLCKARTEFKALEVVDSSLMPAAGSVREKLEIQEDLLCSLKAQ